ncbi:hypothetical protein [Parabacteroides distasonis]|uniref:Uncharacterized protein n=1 Tax=Parabacteroides distasonis TaxID=823 RepID=A0A4V3RRN0_PARDI|nr:hypothetical protein [Parabacteroides distasonis]TGY63910.1 hypothetical protein E5342_00740 [Parabacteroides distasonis]
MILKNLFSWNKKKEENAYNPQKTFGNCQEYPNCNGIKQLQTRESARQILSEDFPKHTWPISGGWGYTQEDAVVLEVDNEGDGVALEYKFLEYRSYEEGIIFRPKGYKLEGFRFKMGKQALYKKNGKSYDWVTMTVSAYTEEDFKLLKNDFEGNNGYINDPGGLKRPQELSQSKRISYEVTGWFDITRFSRK